jgi:hypothetical protein
LDCRGRKEEHFAGNRIRRFRWIKPLLRSCRVVKSKLIKKEVKRPLICAFTEYQKSLIPLLFDKVMLRFLYYPQLGVALDDAYVDEAFCGAEFLFQ